MLIFKQRTPHLLNPSKVGEGVGAETFKTGDKVKGTIFLILCRTAWLKKFFFTTFLEGTIPHPLTIAIPKGDIDTVHYEDNSLVCFVFTEQNRTNCACASSTEKF